ncbi:MAG: aminomethyl-transferring glycine dehydrogenase [Myxococcales bacterium]|nr:aminomethyl-transferring glycine dehydrogenase [Myxococcales bacterium]
MTNAVSPGPFSAHAAGARFADRHIGPRPAEVETMLRALGACSLQALVGEAVPAAIRCEGDMDLPPPRSEAEALATLEALASQNQLFRSFIGAGYHDCFTPPVIQRNILENPGWYTQYTPYQAEISQGRMEALVNFQQMVMDLTGLDVAGASLLDEATAAGEAMQMLYDVCEVEGANTFFVDEGCHPQTIAVVQTRAKPRGISVVVANPQTFAFDGRVFGALLQYPASDGRIVDHRAFIERAHATKAHVAMACDLLALTLLTPPGELGADVALGSAQRFGVPMGFGGPHAAFFSTRAVHTRKMPGRLIGVSKDAQGKRAYRMALQTREQHIRREKATSNICTAQVLLAVMASMYAVYHGPEGLTGIATRVARLTATLRAALLRKGIAVAEGPVFDTLRVEGSPEQIAHFHDEARRRRINLRPLSATRLGLSLDETTTLEELSRLAAIFGAELGEPASALPELPEALRRQSPFLTHPVFSSYHSETEMLRYIRRLESRDLSLTHAMIPLGSCTMKLNATTEMMPITWPSWCKLHPFAPSEQATGYHEIFRQLEAALTAVTGFPGISLQPNAGSQGELAGLLVVRAYHAERGHGHRNVCLIPASAHGTNPASAVMAGYDVVVVKCDDQGNVDLTDLALKAAKHTDVLAALMITYPSTHGVFEEEIKSICATIHEHGGQVYMDGANLNALVGLARPADFGADVCHINLHKTFCIPHGGGGPGMGPIACAAHLAPFLPSHPVVSMGGEKSLGTISAAPWGSADILLISWAYVAMMGAEGLRRSTEIAILNANYIAHRLQPYFPVVYRGRQGRVAHECIVDLRGFKKSAGVEVEDVAKRLMDYGFHAPTMSFPIPGTLMIEPTESESLAELDRFCDALIAIRNEIAEVESGKQPRDNNVLKNAPHTAEVLLTESWERPYSRSQAAYPVAWVRDRKFWPSVGRVDNVFGDRNFVCACPPIESYEGFERDAAPASA